MTTTTVQMKDSLMSFLMTKVHTTFSGPILMQKLCSRTAKVNYANKTNMLSSFRLSLI